jgi:hypothetical protein
MSDVAAQRESRKKKTAECFTPLSLSNQLLDKLYAYVPAEIKEDETKTFLDPACGNGNLLIPVLQRKISFLQRKNNINDVSIINILKTIYGCDIIADNIHECRLRLLKIASLYTTITKEHIQIVFSNIVWTPLERYEKGSLDYSFDFPQKRGIVDVDNWLYNIQNNKWLDNVDIEKGFIGDFRLSGTTQEELCYELFLKIKKVIKVKKYILAVIDALKFRNEYAFDVRDNYDICMFPDPAIHHIKDKPEACFIFDDFKITEYVSDFLAYQLLIDKNDERWKMLSFVLKPKDLKIDMGNITLEDLLDFNYPHSNVLFCK